MVDCDDPLLLSSDEQTKWFSADASNELSPRLLELCDGFGGLGIGASYLGGVPWVSVDWNDLSCEHVDR